MSSGIYQTFKSNLFKKIHDLVNDNIYVALYTLSFTYISTATTYSTSFEMSGIGYDIGGQLLLNKSVTSGASAVWDADNPTWPNSIFTASHAFIYDSTTGNTPICAIDFGGPQIIPVGRFTLQFASSGIIRIT